MWRLSRGTMLSVLRNCLWYMLYLETRELYCWRRRFRGVLWRFLCYDGMNISHLGLFVFNKKLRFIWKGTSIVATHRNISDNNSSTWFPGSQGNGFWFPLLARDAPPQVSNRWSSFPFNRSGWDEWSLRTHIPGEVWITKLTVFRRVQSLRSLHGSLHS